MGQGALDELMVQVKERAGEHKLDKLVQENMNRIFLLGFTVFGELLHT